VGSPYGEARRLAYFRLICQQADTYLPCDISFLVENVLKQALKMEDSRTSYKRTTGKIATETVCYNYLRFASWLDFLKIEGSILSKNAFTAFFSTLESTRTFNLSEKEKLAYFIHLWSRVPELMRVLQRLRTSKALPSGKLRSGDITEHDAETFLEWFVDLGLADPTRRNFGAFVLTGIGDHVKKEGKTFEEACCVYARGVLGKDVNLNQDVPASYLWREMLALAEQLSSHIRSPVDPRLVAVLPILLHLQIRILVDKRIFVSRDRLVSLAEKATDQRSATFAWDQAYQSGFLKFR